MKLTLVGMSNTGKSYWSKKLLKEKKFKRFDCDGLINERLDGEIASLNSASMRNVSQWLGQPYDLQYPSHSKKYLKHERKVMLDAITFAQAAAEKENIVIDTSGSVIYMDHDILNKLQELTKIVYLETPEKVKKEMYELYLKEPKPVIWEESFKKRVGESNMQALARCYPELLAYRTKKYESIADVTLEYHTLRTPGFTIDDFIGKIHEK